MHGDFLAEQIDERLVGGVSLLSGYVNKVRREEKNVIYAVAGDMFRGSVIDSEYKVFGWTAPTTRLSRSVWLSPPARWTTRRCWRGYGRTVSDPLLTQNPKKWAGLDGNNEKSAERV